MVGAPDSRVMMPAPVQTTASPTTGTPASAAGSPAGTAARIGGGVATGKAPSVWAAAWKYVPLLIR